jgi:hypothetical protein
VYRMPLVAAPHVHVGAQVDLSSLIWESKR